MSERYAVYFVPHPDTSLWQYGCRAVGYDSALGCDVPLPDHAFYHSSQARDWSAAPRTYGFHSTLKPPFALSDGTSIAQLEQAAEDFAAKRHSFTVERLKVAALGGFVALVPSEPSQDLSQLAADCVTAFEPFRAPLTDADRARRMKSPLTDNQLAHLDRWGYPYVLDEFRFHMTLTGSLPDYVRSGGIAALLGLYAAIDGPVQFDAIAICAQADRNSRFRIRRRFEFAG